MNRNFENRKPTKVYAKSKENQMIIKALNMYGRVPEKKYCIDEKEDLISGCEVCEDILKMIDKLKEKYLNVVADDDLEYVKKLQQENKQLQQQRKKQKEVIDKAIEYIRIYRSYQKIDNKDYLKGRDEIGCLDIYQVDELLDILKEEK